MRTAVAWLEEALLLTREENRVQVFPSSLRVSSIEAAQVRLARADIAEHYREQLLRICQALFEADADEGISTDELMMATGLTPEGVRDALYHLEGLGITTNDTALTAFVHAGVERSFAGKAGCCWSCSHSCKTSSRYTAESFQARVPLEHVLSCNLVDVFDDLVEEPVAEDVVPRQSPAVGRPDAESGRLWIKLCHFPC